MKFLISSILVRNKLERKLKYTEDKAMPHPEMLKTRSDWAVNSLNTLGLEPEIVFNEDFRLEDNMVLICNHRSFLDILIIESLMKKLHKKQSTFVAKKELKSSFVLGRLYTLFGALFIDRDNPRDFIKLLRQIKKIIKEFPKGNVFVIYPEGTRNKNKDINSIEVFKEGFLKIANQTKVNILPVFIEGGVESYFENVGGDKRKIKVRVGAIIETENKSVKDIENIYKQSFNLK